MTHEHKSKEELRSEAAEILKNLAEKTEPLKPKDRLAIPSQEMPTQQACIRRSNINEVAEGYTREQAILEAKRCLRCKNKPFVAGCPLFIDIPGFVGAIADEKFAEAAAILKRNTLLPAVCGRVCPQETQCQEPCTIGKS